MLTCVLISRTSSMNDWVRPPWKPSVQLMLNDVIDTFVMEQFCTWSGRPVTQNTYSIILLLFFFVFFICFRFAYSQTKYMWRKLSKTGVQVCSQQFLAHSFISRMFHFVYGAFFLSISGQNKYKLYNLYLKSFPSNNRQSMKVYICVCVCVCPCACVCVCVCL